MNLSPRETQVMELLIAGKHDKEIARELGVSQSTVRTYVRLVEAKLDANGRIPAAIKFDRMRR